MLKSLRAHRQMFFLVLSIVLLVGLFCPTVSSADDVQDFAESMMDRYFSKIDDLEVTIRSAAIRLFGLLVVAQFTWSVIQLFLAESLSFGTVFVTVARQILISGFFYWFLFDKTVLRSILNSFAELAGSGLTPGEMLFLVGNTTRNIMTAIGNADVGVFQGIGLWLVGVFACLIVGFAASMGIALLFLALLENYIAGSLGVILLGFGGSDYTRDFAISYIKGLVRIGFKYFLISLVVHIGVNAFAHEMIGITNIVEGSSLMEKCQNLILESFLFYAIVQIIPILSDTLISGVSMDTGRAMGALNSGAGGLLAAGGGLMAAGRYASKRLGGLSDYLRSTRTGGDPGSALAVPGSAVEQAANAFQDTPRGRRRAHEENGMSQG